MERLRGSVQPRPAPLGRTSRLHLRPIKCATTALACLLLFITVPSWAQAPGPGGPGTNGDAASPAEIVAARELFRLGTEDADAGRYVAGLEKFRRVAAVKETGAVRFNIARCEEALGKTGTALADFELAAREAHDDPKSGDVGTLAAQRADALRPRVPRLTVLPPSPFPDGLSVSLDGDKLASATLGAPLPVDPGPHVVDARAPGAAPFHIQVTLSEGDAKKVPLSLAAADPALVPGGDQGSGAVPDATSPGSSQRTWGVVALIAGGALAIGSGAFLALHDSAVSTINGDCPSLSCPASMETSVNGSVSQARAYEGLSIGLLAGAVVAAGTGVVLFATAPKAQSPSGPPTPAASATSMAVTAGASAAPAGLTFRASF